jgi:hypothetical protein
LTRLSLVEGVPGPHERVGIEVQTHQPLGSRPARPVVDAASWIHRFLCQGTPEPQPTRSENGLYVIHALVAQFAVSHDVICTFHSVERKTGRSMALANVAELLRRRGQRILVVDWDLENPGLDYFFPDPTPGQPTPGVIDLFIAYRTEMSRPIALSDDDTVLPTERLDTYLRAVPGGGLFVLPAGKRDDGYSGRITSFDWNEFLKEWEGERFIEHLRQKFNAAVTSSSSTPALRSQKPPESARRTSPTSSWCFAPSVSRASTPRRRSRVS